jgi:hypothetical protein
MMFCAPYSVVNPRGAGRGQVFVDAVKFDILHKISTVSCGLVVVQEAGYALLVSVVEICGLPHIPKRVSREVGDGN